MALMDLDIFSLTGRTAKPVAGAVIRELERADVELLAVTRAPAAQSTIKRLSDRHHMLARNLAGGMPEGEAAIMAGLTGSRVSILKADPTFQELLAFYREDVTRVYRDTHEALAGVSHTALQILAERLEDEPEKMSTGQVLDIIKLGADRTGHGPQTMATNVNVNVDMSNRLEAARKRVRERSQSPSPEPELLEAQPLKFKV